MDRRSMSFLWCYLPMHIPMPCHCGASQGLSQCASDVADGWAPHVIIKRNHPEHVQFPVHIQIASGGGGMRRWRRSSTARHVMMDRLPVLLLWEFLPTHIPMLCDCGTSEGHHDERRPFLMGRPVHTIQCRFCRSTENGRHSFWLPFLRGALIED